MYRSASVSGSSCMIRQRYTNKLSNFYCISSLNCTFFVCLVKDLSKIARLIIIYNMSANGKLDQSPNHFIVLDAISKGISNVNKISKASKLDKVQVELIANDLLTQRLIIKTEKKSLIFRKKTLEFGITDIGMKLLNTKKEVLEQKKQQMQQSYNNGDGTQLENYMDANRMWMPMMLFSGIMDIMFFTSMMSFMGLGINPLENAMMGTESSSGGDVGHEQTTNSNDAEHSAHDQHDQFGTSGETGSSGEGADYDTSSFDSRSFDGFDGGGFDSF